MRGLALALSTLVIAHAALAQEFSDPRFASELVVSLPAFQPVGVTWASDGRMFIWQKNGVVRVYHDGVLHQTPFVDLSAQVNTFDDRGMLGFALDPNFSQNGHVYLAYVYEEGGNPSDSGAKISRLTRVTANPADPDVALPGSEVILIDDIPADGGSHTAGTLRFAPDGTLFFSNGDGASAAFADPLALGAQDVDSLRGKILRINPDGSAPAPPQLTNPYYDGTNSIRSKVWASGLRNAFRYDFHPTLGDLYAGEVGWNTWEEVDRIVPGGNYGWPCFEGVDPQPLYQALFPAACSQVPAASVVSPLYTYDHSFGTAALGGAFYTGSVYPAQYRDSFFFGDYSGSWIRRLVLFPDGSIAENLGFATSTGVIVSIELGPDGLLYLVDFLQGEVRRLRYDGVVAAASASPSSGYSPLDIAFSSAGSVDPLGGALAYFWDFGDGQSSTEANPLHTYVSGQVETFDASLTVTNPANEPSMASVQVTVGSLPPVPQIGAPSGGVGVQPGEVVFYSGSAIDPDEGALPQNALHWEVLLHHNDHIHAFVGSTGASGTFVAEYHGTGVYAYELRLTATDSSGLRATSSVTIPVLDDSTPPSVPVDVGATSAGSHAIGLVWTASSDGAGVSRYHVERCLGPACSTFVEVATPATPIYQDTGLSAGTAYTYRVRAEDLAGNLGGYSEPATATTAPAPPPLPGLVAAYGFEEGSGSTALDASGNGNAGTLAGPTWGPGRYGQALGFDGVADVVVVGDSSSLDLTTGMTIEAWVFPTVPLSGWKAIAQKELDAYFLNANTAGGRVGVGGSFGSCCTVLEGPSALAPGEWTHVAGTYDGAVLRLYLDGFEVASQSRTGSLEVNGSPLRLGGNTYAGEFFPGSIDELRIYDRALSAAEIQQDMGEPVGGGPPNVSLIQPAVGALLFGTITLAAYASDDSGGVAGVQFLLDGADLGAEDTAAPFSRAWNTRSVANGTYTLSARARDGSQLVATSAPVIVTVENGVKRPLRNRKRVR